jgi:hypothetical protein
MSLKWCVCCVRRKWRLALVVDGFGLGRFWAVRVVWRMLERRKGMKGVGRGISLI